MGGSLSGSLMAFAILAFGLGSILALAEDVPAEDAAPPPVATLEQLEKSGSIAKAREGWAERYLAAANRTERLAAMRKFVALAERQAGRSTEDWVTACANGAEEPTVVLTGTRVVLVLAKARLGKTTPQRMRALADGASLVIDRIAGFTPRPQEPMPPRRGRPPSLPIDRFGRLILVQGGLQLGGTIGPVDGRIWAAEPTHVGVQLTAPIARAIAADVADEGSNANLALLEPGVSLAVARLTVGELGEPGAVPPVVEWAKKARESFEQGWVPGCLPSEWFPRGDELAHLLDQAWRTGGDPLDRAQALFHLDRRSISDRAVASHHDLIVEMLRAALPPAGFALFQQHGVAPVGEGLDELLDRVRAAPMRADAWQRDRDGFPEGAARDLRDAADELGASLAGEQLVFEALSIEHRKDSKKARSAARKYDLIDDFVFAGPVPDNWLREESINAGSRLVPHVLARAVERRDFKTDDPIRVDVEWKPVKHQKRDVLPRTSRRDKRGITWGGRQLASVKLTKDLGEWVRVRPLGQNGDGSVLCVDGRPLDRWPDGSYVVPGKKGRVLTLSENGSITCALAWRDEAFVRDGVRLAAQETRSVAALRPWAARGLDVALPAITGALVKLGDADLLREMRLLAPYAGGDAAAFDAMIARAKGKPPVLAAYLAICRGNRDPDVLDRLVKMAAGGDVGTVKAVQAILSVALFRDVTESGDDLTKLWAKGRKWIAATGYAEAEAMRDVTSSWPGFVVQVDADATGRACLGSSTWGGGRGTGTLVLEPGSGKSLSVRWRSNGAPLHLSGMLTDGKKTVPLDLRAAASGSGFQVSTFPLPAPPKKRMALILHDPCAEGYQLDAFAIGAKPLP